MSQPVNPGISQVCFTSQKIGVAVCIIGVAIAIIGGLALSNVPYLKDFQFDVKIGFTCSGGVITLIGLYFCKKERPKDVGPPVVEYDTRIEDLSSDMVDDILDETLAEVRGEVQKFEVGDIPDLPSLPRTNENQPQPSPPPPLPTPTPTPAPITYGPIIEVSEGSDPVSSPEPVIESFPGSATYKAPVPCTTHATKNPLKFRISIHVYAPAPYFSFKKDPTLIEKYEHETDDPNLNRLVDDLSRREGEVGDIIFRKFSLIDVAKKHSHINLNTLKIAPKEHISVFRVKKLL